VAPLPAARRTVSDVPLRRPDVALEVSPVWHASPASSLGDEAACAELVAGQSPHRAQRPELETLAPPDLPPDFEALAAGLAASRRQWQPTRMKLPVSSPALRRHRLTDGDSLERLAERYLGNSARAGEIFDANRDVLDQPDVLPLGRIVRIPPRESADALVPASR
jgi:nucleoid-associated protein YgaU